jgi:transposase
MTVMVAPALEVTDDQRQQLEAMSRSSSIPHRKVIQAKALLWAADGVANEEIARRCDTTPDTVRRWRARFAERGIAGVGTIAPGRGRKPGIPPDVIEAIVHDTLHERPDDDSTHWSTRTMADRHGVGKDTVARIWRARRLKPWLAETFKLSNDPRFEEKLVDVVGLYLDPPERAVVLCFDEKTQTQALDRTQPSLPLKPGRAGTMTYDYKRNGTVDLFAALNAATGEVLTHCRRRHTPRLPLLSEADRPPRPTRPRGAPRAGQPVGAHASRCRTLAGPPQAQAVPPPLHPDEFVVAEPRRALVQGAHRQAAPTGQLRERRRAGRRHRAVGLALERRPEALHVAQDRRGDHRQVKRGRAALAHQIKSATDH